MNTINTILVALIGSLSPTVAIVAAYVLSRRKVTQVATVTETKLDTIHVLVNSRLEEALERIAALEKALGIKPNGPIPKRDNYD